MPIITLIITLAVIGFLVWLITTYIPMSAGWKKLIQIVAIVGVALWLLNVFGAFAYLSNVHVGSVGHVRR